MNTFRVTWEIDIDDVATPREAAEKALSYQRNPASIATVFKVTERVLASEKHPGRDPSLHGPDRLVLVGPTVVIDLDEEA